LETGAGAPMPEWEENLKLQFKRTELLESSRTPVEMKPILLEI
jgi:hypothetical protein